MHANYFPEPQHWGFFSPEGFFQPLHSLTPRELPFVSKSVQELNDELHNNLRRERYETCALLRDELAKRETWFAATKTQQAEGQSPTEEK